MTRLFSLAAAALAATAFCAPSYAADAKASADGQNIVATAQKAGQFTTLLTAAKAAGLAETLQSGGPFTVFAPTDEAFDELPQGMADRLLAAENKEQLRAVLGYHVVQGQAIASGGVRTNVLLKTMQGDNLAINATGGGIAVSPAAADYAGAPGVAERGVARVAKADIGADNGTVHVIDTVLLPPEVQKALPQKREH
jgi:uncharacterized surface protein with fasciclin (FAS1) repeats